MAKVGEKGFTVGKIYENRHNHRWAIVEKKEISDEGVVLYQLREWDLMNPDSNRIDWVAESARRHWMLATIKYTVNEDQLRAVVKRNRGEEE